MEMKKRAVICFFVAAVAVVMLPGTVMSRRIDVGDKVGWAPGSQVNYTDWAIHNQFYVGDWLLFRFDKHYYNVLEVNKTSYDTCNENGFIQNITRGGRDVFQLMEARPYYFLSGRSGGCWQGMKLAINVSITPAPTQAPTVAADTSASASTIDLCRRGIMSIWVAMAAIQTLNLLLEF